MSSGLPLTPGMAQTIVRSMSPLAMRKITTLGMTPRQAELNWLWAWYACVRYDACKVDWDGSESVDRVDASAICTAGVLPGGFYDAGANFPLKFRKPSAPYWLSRVIVNRFTSLLFSEKTHPRLKCAGDEVAEDYVGALADACRLWTRFGEARTYGGAQGTFCVGFKFVAGRPFVEVHDPRWVTPRFKNPETFELSSIDKRWMWPEHVLGTNDEYEEVWYWTRRIVDEKRDVVWNKVPVGDGTEPNWGKFQPDQMVEHNLGECPAIWGQNMPVPDAEDGEPDCIGCFDMIEEMNALLAQSGMSLKQNLDPTVIINSDLKLNALQKGSDNAIKLEKGGGAAYMEGNFQGSKQGLEHAMKLRDLVLEMAQCVLDQEDAESPETATKARQRFAAMEARSDVLREQYGHQGVMPLVEKMVRAIQRLSIGTTDAEGRKVVQPVKLPPREVVRDGQKTYEDRTPPEADLTARLNLEWPPHRRPTVQEAQAAAAAVKTARDSSSISDEKGVAFLAPFFGTEDAQAELDLIRSEQAERDKQMKLQAAAAWGGR